MSSRLKWCTPCWTHHWDGAACLPTFEVRNAEFGEDDWEEVRAAAPEYAAETWADRSDSDGDYGIISGSEVTLDVRDADGVITKWKVTGEAVPQYTATEVDGS